MSTRTERERAFHDHAYATSARARVGRYYAVNAVGERTYRDALTAAAPGGAQVLEYGCGQGSAAFDLAATGNDVLGIDISPVAIAQAAAEAAERGLADRTSFRVMDAEHLDLPAASCDVVCGSGILHHLDVAAAAAEVARVLRPEGTAVFLEPLGHNPAINAYRAMTPELRTPDEHPLLRRDLALLSASFGEVRTTFSTLTALLAAPLAGRRAFAPVLGALERVDRAVLSAPWLGPYAWCCTVLLRAPRA